MKLNLNHPRFSVYLFLVLGISMLGCAFIGSIIENNEETSPSENVPKQTNATPTLGFDSRARFVFFIPHRSDSNFGFIDQKGNIVIPPQFDHAEEFAEGLAAVKESGTGLWGYIDLSGEYVIQPNLFLASDFSEGLAFVQISDTDVITCIDQKGQIVFEIPNQDFFSSPNNNAAISYKFHDGIALIREKISEGVYSPNYIDKTGKTLFPPGSLSDQGNASFSGGYAVATFSDSLNEISIINTSGKIVAKLNCPLQFSGCSSVNSDGATFPFSEGVTLAWASDSSGTKVGFFDTNGHFVISPQFLNAFSFSEGLAPVQDIQTKRWGYIDHSGKLVIPYQFRTASEFSEGLAAVWNSTSRCGFINPSGDFVIEISECLTPWDAGGIIFQNGIAGISLYSYENGLRTGYIDRQGNLVYVSDPY